MLSFSSEIFIIGVNPYVPVPENILTQLFAASGKKSGPIPVKGTLNDKPFIQTVVKFAGMWRLYLNGPMRKAAGIDVGDTAHVRMEFDPKSRDEKMPEGLVRELANDKNAQKAFDDLAPYRKKEILRYLNFAKTDETLQRNITKVMQMLRGEEPEGLIVLTYRWSQKKA